MAGATQANSLGAIVHWGNLLQRAPSSPKAPRRPHLMGGGCDGPLGMAKEANDDALAAIWRRGNLVHEDEPRERHMSRSQG